MATKETKQYRQLASEVDRVERTALDRAPTGEEVQQVAELVATLRVSAAGGKRYRNLLHRASRSEGQTRQAARHSRCSASRTGRQPWTGSSPARGARRSPYHGPEALRRHPRRSRPGT